MVDEVVFHLGDCKTGSTSIQKVLRLQAWTGGKRVQYATSGKGPKGKPVLHHGELAHRLSRPGKGDSADRRFRAYARRLERAEGAIGVISSEHFEFVPPARLKEALDAHFTAFKGRIRLIAYVRPHAARLVSSFAEQTKLGKPTESLDAFVSRSILLERYFYADRFREWRRCFGESFTLRPMIRDVLYRGSVVDDFLQFLFGDTEFATKSGLVDNESLSLENLLVAREAYRHITVGSRTSSIGRNLGRYLAANATGPGTRLRMHRALAEEVLAAYREDAEKLDTAFFADGAFGDRPMLRALEKAVEEAPDEPQSMRLEDHFTPDQLRMIRVWSQLIGQMFQAEPEGWGQHFTELRLAEEQEASAG